MYCVEDAVLFLRKEVESDDDNNNEWDDSQLVRAFEKAVSSAKIQIPKNIPKEMVLEEGEIPDTPSDTSSSKKKKKNKKKKNENNLCNWSVGDACRAVYSEDGKEYEAEILAILDKNWCRIKYIGYNNKEEVLLKELNPSLGQHSIWRQQEMAWDEFFSDSEEMEDEEDDDVLDQEMYKQKLHEATHKPSVLTSKRVPFLPHRTPRTPAMFDPSMPLPPPPVMPRFATTPMKGLSTRRDAHSAMLVSWYLCGYYTGCYERDFMDQKYS